MREITPELVGDFENFLYESEKAQNTIEKYMRDVRVFLRWLGSRKIDKQAVLEYKNRLILNYAPNSTNSVLSSLNAFFGYLGWYELKVKSLKLQRQIFRNKDKELTRAEYERLLRAAKSKNKEQLYYIMQTMASTGIRISELVFINVEAVRNGIAQVNCKGKQRQVFLPCDLCKKLAVYIKKQKIKSGSVFISRSGKPLDRTRVWKLLKKLCESANVPKCKVFPHNFRHLFAKTFYSLHKDIVRLADILGHSSINTTRIYTIESGDIHRRQLNRLRLLL